MHLAPRLLLAAALLTSPAFAAAAAKDAKKSAPPNKKPTLLVDSSPIAAKPGAVTSYADVVEPVLKAVVSINSTTIVRERVNPIFRQFFPNLPDERESPQRGLGSGVIVSPDGYILTNNHVVEGADELKVSLNDGREFIAKVIGTDPKTDVAVVRIDADKLRVGDVVFAVGNPLGVGQTVTMGIVSAKGRSVGILGDIGGYEDFIQTDAAINMGNSGGALVDARGRLIGVNSAILSPSRGNIGIGFAIPINMASSIMNSLVETGTVARGYLGVATVPLTSDFIEQLKLPPDAKGLIVEDVIPGTAAEKAGIKLLDVIVAVNDHPVTNRDELRLMIAQLAPGSVAKVKLIRDSKERVVNVTLDLFADNPNELFAGVDVAPLAFADRARLRLPANAGGLMITRVAEDSPFRRELREDMIVLELNEVAVSDLATARRLVKPGRNLVRYYYRGAPQYVILINE